MCYNLDIRTVAKKQGGDYIINGSKMWITNGLQADWICLLANTGDGPAHQNKSLIVVPLNTPGLADLHAFINSILCLHYLLYKLLSVEF